MRFNEFLFHFFCTNKRNETKKIRRLLFYLPIFTFTFALMQKKSNKRKNQGCTFLPTTVLFSAKQKELASLKQLFVFNAPKSTSASRQKSEADPPRNIVSLVLEKYNYTHHFL